MPQTDIETIDDLPIKHDSKIEVEIGRLTDDCIKCLVAGRGSAAQVLTEKIDKMVYKLYGLSAEEIQIIENSSPGRIE
jgi:hypothetical protein